MHMAPVEVFLAAANIRTSDRLLTLPRLLHHIVDGCFLIDVLALHVPHRLFNLLLCDWVDGPVVCPLHHQVRLRAIRLLV